jgi:dihydroneopterin aldolase
MTLAPTPTRLEAVRRGPLKVFVKRLRVDAEIGVYAHEKGRAQPLVVDVELELGEQRVDRFADTVNYETVAAQARALAGAGHVDLVEEYADRLARACLDDPRVRGVRVRVEKPEAIPGAEAAGCEVALSRA